MRVNCAGRLRGVELDMSVGPYRSKSRQIFDKGGSFVGNFKSYVQKFSYSNILCKKEFIN